MALIAAGVVAALAAGSGIMKSRSERKARRKLSRRFGRAVNETEAFQMAGLNQQEQLIKQAIQQQLGGYDTAKREAGRLGRQQRQSIFDRETQAGSRLSQNLANTGLGSTTIGANLQRGIASDTNRQLGGLSESLAQMYGNLALGRAGAEAQGSQNLAGLAGHRADIMSQLAQARQLRENYQGTLPGGGAAQYLEPIPGLGQNILGGLQTGAGVYAGIKSAENNNAMNQQWLNYLYGGRPGSYNPNAGQGMNLNTFSGY